MTENFWLNMAIGVFLFTAIYRRHQINVHDPNVLSWTRIFAVSAGLAVVGLVANWIS